MRDLNHYLRQAGQARWAQGLATQQRLQQAWESHMAAPWATQAWPLRYQDGKLTLAVATSVWASQLRHQQRRLLSHLQGHPLFHGLKEIRLRVLPPQSLPSARVRRQSTLGLSSRARVVVQGGADATSDPLLRAALRRLAAARAKA